MNEFYLCILDEFRLLGYNKNVEPDGCHNRITEHEVEAMPQNSASHLVATDGSLFLFGLFLGSLKIHIYNHYRKDTAKIQPVSRIFPSKRPKRKSRLLLQPAKLVNKPRRVSPPKRRKGHGSFSAAACTWTKILLTLQTCALAAYSEQCVRCSRVQSFCQKSRSFFDSLSRLLLQPAL